MLDTALDGVDSAALDGAIAYVEKSDTPRINQ